MSGVDSQTIQKLRELTGAGVMDCKRALEECGMDMDKAAASLKEKGQAKMEKRTDRATGAGFVVAHTHNGRIGALIHVCAETDFVVRSEPFQNLAHELALQLSAVPAANVEEFLSQPYVRDEKQTIKDLVDDVIRRTGENIQVAAIARLEA